MKIDHMRIWVGISKEEEKAHGNQDSFYIIQPLVKGGKVVGAQRNGG
jgi:hypothetical protein